MTKLGILFGGRSPEHDISVKSADTIIKAADKKRFDVLPIFISRQGVWELDFNILKKKVDIIFPVLHGVFGEDGTIQGLLDLIDMPYVGADTKSSSIGMDKAILKNILCSHNLPVAKHILAYKEDCTKDFYETAKDIESSIGFPCFIKPSNCGSSIGISMVSGPNELKKAIDTAFMYDRKVLIEQAIEGKEIEIALLGNYFPSVSVPGEIIAADRFYSYRAKYFNKESKVVIPASISEGIKHKIQNMAQKVYIAIDCCGMARVDFFVEKGTNSIFINEVNTIPGFTSISMYPLLWEKSGISLTKLISMLVDLGFSRHKEKRDCGYLAVSGCESLF